MSASAETLSPSKVSPYDENDDQTKMKKGMKEQVKQEVEENGSKSIINVDERKVDNISLKCNKALHSCPLVSASMQLKKDKNNGRRLQTWKEQHLENINLSTLGDAKVNQNPEVQINSISIICRGRPEIVLSEPFASSPKACLFTLKEGSRYRLRFNFIVSNKTVSGLKYVNTLWKAGVRVDRSEALLGSFSPKQDPYSYELREDTAPSGIFIRGLYCARTKVVDDLENCYLDIKYYFEIQKSWPSCS